jgi:SAM-dependent methyltransferase
MIYYLIFILIVFLASFGYFRVKRFIDDYYYSKEKAAAEHFDNKPIAKFKDCTEVEKIYDRFYCDIYDELFYSKYKNQFEILQLRENVFNKWKDTDNPIKILDLGSGTGHHVDLLNQYSYDTVGLDKSQHMINISKKNYPLYEFKLGDFMEKANFEPLSFTHVTCFFYTVYYIDEVEVLFQNVNSWLKHNGVFCIHLVDKQKFDPVLEKSSSLIPLYNPQKHERKTHTSLVFNNFQYEGDWLLDKMPCQFVELFKFKDKSNRRNYHTLNMYPMKKYVKAANKTGFKLVQTIDLGIVNHPYNYLFCFKKKFG